MKVWLLLLDFSCLLLLAHSQKTYTYDLWDPDPICNTTGLCLSPTHSEGYMNYEERLMFFLINQFRTDPVLYVQESLVQLGCEIDDSEGGNPIYWRPQLCWAAKFHARQMATKEECFKFETCEDCNLFGSCSMEARLKAFYRNSATEILAKGTAMEALNSLLANPTYCSRILSAKWEDLGVGMAKGPEGIYWSLVFGVGPTIFSSILLVAGIHKFEENHVLFRGIYNDLRLDDPLKEKVVYLDEVAYPATLKRSYGYSKGKGKSGIWQVSVPLTDLEKMKEEDMANPDNHCHSYFFSFKTDHSNTLFRLPKMGYFYLTGYGGCVDIYSREQPQNPHREKFEAESEQLFEERKQRMMERELKRIDARKKMEERARELGQKNTGGYTWFYVILVVGFVGFLILRRPRWLRFEAR